MEARFAVPGSGVRITARRHSVSLLMRTPFRYPSPVLVFSSRSVRKNRARRDPRRRESAALSPCDINVTISTLKENTIIFEDLKGTDAVAS